jgi:2-polyprenyl-3-methyl-5-hydroxy-6-metoxy-1,4-benzoquinol methylase
LTVRSLLPDRSERLLDIGCGPVIPSYPYSDKAVRVTCIDWKLHRFDPIPPNIECVEGDFTTIDLPLNSYDAIIASDVFEHILLERESLFVKKCVSVLKPGGYMIVSVPHRGTFAWLDPYKMKPAIHRLLWRLGLYKSLHNGSCDIRKGHKHYTVEELAEKFKPLQLERVSYRGYFFDPLLSWASALSGGSLQFPGGAWLERCCNREFKRDWGQRAFNMAIQFYKPLDTVRAA